MTHANFQLDKTPDGVKLRVSMKDSYKAFAEQLRKDRPELSLVQIVALAVNHNSTRNADYYMSFHYPLGHLVCSPLNDPTRYWYFNKTVAQVLDEGHEATLLNCAQSEMVGWYICGVCGLVVRDTACKSCSMSCPVCAVMVAESAGLETWFISSNDYVRPRFSNEILEDLTKVLLGEIPDETGSDDPVTLSEYVSQHTKCARAAVILLQYYGGAEDIPMSPVTQKHLKGQTRPGADPMELRNLTLRHIRAADRCMAKALTKLPGAVMKGWSNDD